MNTPLISIGIPTYNRDVRLKRAIESVVTQDYQNLEIIISDNASTDNTFEICTTFAKQDPRITYIRQSTNRGGLANFMEVLEQSQGEFFMWLGDDDALSPSYVSECLKVLISDPTNMLVSGRAKYYFPNGQLHFDGYTVNVLEETGTDRVISYCSQVADNGVFYGLYLKRRLLEVSKLLLLPSVQTMGEDWIFLVNVAFLGKIITLEHINISRDTKVYTRETYRNLAKNYPNPVFEGDYPHLSISMSLFNDIAWMSPTYDVLDEWTRLSLAWDAQKIICQRHGVNLNRSQLLLLNYYSRCQKEPLNQLALAELEKAKKQIINTSFEEVTNSLIDVFLIGETKSVLNPRHQIAKNWVELSEENLEVDFNGELGKQHQELLTSGIKQQLHSDEEQQFISELNQYIAKGWKQDKIAQHFLAASLYCYPHQLPSKWFENAEVPEFLVDYFVNFMFETPSFFKQLGEADQYYHYVKEWVDFLHLCVTTETDSPIWQQMAWVFTQRANFIPLYFNSQNLKEIYVKRAEIMEIALKQKRFQLDYTFPPRDKNRKKIRVGFLSNHFTPQTETFATLPAFEYLDRGFEVILYANMTNGHPLEKYCESRADRLVQLPEDLNAKVQLIRQDNLDIIWIGTNITAVTNQIAILALHRLARIQINSVSSCVTGGMKNIDYYISGDLTEPENAQAQYQEQLISVKGPAHCYSYPLDIEKVTIKLQRNDLNIDSDAVVFISGANFYKITPEMRDIWSRILEKIPNSVLVLYPYNPNWSSSYQKDSFVEAFYAVFAKYGIDRTRLKTIDPLPSREDIKECLKFADVYLDSYPFAGVTSLLDPLEVGLTPITKDGNSFRSIMGAAILRSIGLDDLVVQDEGSYINLAVKLGTDEKLRNQYREQILEKMSNNPPFLDSKAYSEQIGTVLKQLFEKHLF